MAAFSETPVFEHFFVARQPIFYENGQIWGYELLFRSGPKFNIAEMQDQDQATFCVATCGFIRSQEDLDQTKKICINFTEKALFQNAPLGLPPTVTVIEVLEDVTPSEKMLEQLIRYKQEGYLVAIDDFVGNRAFKDLLDVADVIKVDVLNKDIDEVKAICNVFQGAKALKLAEKVEDRAMLGELRALGFTLFQGYYFAKPELLSGKKLGATEVSKMRILQATEDAAVTPEKIEVLISADPSIVYRLLRFLNSAAFGFSIKINSIRHAITLLGVKRLKNWLRMAILSDLLGNKSTELYVMAINRGRLLEELVREGQIADASADTMFLFGLLSLIEPMLEAPFETILNQLPLPDDIKRGYVDEASPYNRYLQLLAAIERSVPEEIQKYCTQLQFNEKILADASLRSIVWASEMQQILTKS